MKIKISLMAVLSAASFSATAAPINLGIASNYNAFIFGDFTLNTIGNSVDRALAVGGNALLDASSIGNADGNHYALIVNGDFAATPTGGSVNGNVWIGGTNNMSENYTVGGHVDTPATAPAPVDFAAARTELSTLSSQIAGMAATGSYVVQDEWNPNNWVFSGSGSEIEYFSLTAGQLDSFNDLFFSSIAAGTTLVFNVSGTEVNLNWQWQVLNNDYNVLFNFYEATSLTIDETELRADVLAVNATVNPGTGRLYGTIVADTWNNSVSLGTPVAVTPVPEPSSYALMLAGIAVTGFAAARRRRA